MLSLSTQTKLAELIEAIADHERVVRDKQEVLLSEPAFSPYRIFGALDKHRTGYLVPLDIVDFLKEFGLFATVQEAEQFVESFGDKSKAKLCSEDFVKLVLPRNPSTRSIMLKREGDLSRPLSKEVMFGVAKIVQAEIDGLNRLRKYRDALSISHDYSTSDAFSIIDKYNSGYITSPGLNSFLAQNAVHTKPGTSSLFIERLDKDMDNRLSFFEFSSGLMGQGSAKYPYSEKKTSLYNSEYKSRFESPERQNTFGSSELEYSSSYKGSPYRSKGAYEEASTGYVSPFKLSYTDYKKSMGVEKKLDYSSSPSKSKKAASELAFAMEEQINSHKRFNKLKEELAEQTDFNLTDGFRLLDTNGKGFVTLPEFCGGLKDLDVNVSGNAPSLLFRHMDRDADARLRFSDFCSAFAPRDKRARAVLEARQPYYMHHLVEKDVYFSAKTRDMLKQAFEALFEREQALEIVRQRLKKNVSFNVYDGFNAIDLGKKGQITSEMVIVEYNI
eukprot:TRINITY_DN10910_c0_g1_i2.p1 TRINITY_DN10910_c0_g1~~TRINITY_DN10910_c0_g1_i2.p1  ORF type:complete len:501 (+),score=119.87 TRINITY_DN10910_c0_g1_i2:40-1542(+)